ncbi:ankyrin repeat domain-containing protein [Streptomyces sp. NPDC002817]|uniref:ankyrin repeat domain-containing protein n=1 Tax=Streptomyces sp. NPDC088357 TaxID=3154655 RepID=UPI00343E3C1B
MTGTDDDLFHAVSPAHGARPPEQVARIRALLAEGADVSAPDEQGATPLHRAVQAPYQDRDPLPSLEVVRALLESGADVHARDRTGVTPAARAVLLNDTATQAAVDRSVAVLELLVEHGARLDGPCGDVMGGSFAHHSTTATPVYAFLLDHGAPTADTDRLGNTPLHATVSSARPQLVELLLQRGADTAAVNQLGQTPLGVALRLDQYNDHQRRARSQIVPMLEAAGAPAHVRYPPTEGGPLPIDMDAVRRAAAELRAEGEDDPRLQRHVDETYDSYQHFVDVLKRNCGPDGFVWVLELCRRILGATGTARTLVGEQEVRTAFFHHGDLVVQGNLQVMRTFVVTGSLTVEGCLADSRPASGIVVGGDVTAQAVYTDGDMHVSGDIEADIVYGCYNDHTLEARTIRGRLVISDDHDVQAHVEAEHHFDIDDYRQGYGEGVQKCLRTLLVDEVFAEDDDDEASLNPGELFSRLWEGEAVFRTSG